MEITRRTLVLVAVALSCIVTPLRAEQTAAPSSVSFTRDQMEQFLLNAKLVSLRPVGRGVTNTRVGTFTDGEVTHRVQIQTIDEMKPMFETVRGVELNFKDSYKYNIAAYRLAILLGLGNVPVSVLREFQGRPAAYTWWVDEVMFEETERLKRKTTGPDPQRYAAQVHVQRVFDELIQNRDRNTGNTLWTTDWTLWMIDHTRAFRLGTQLLAPKLLERIEGSLHARLKTLTEADVKSAVGDTLDDREIKALVVRSRVITEHFDKRIAELGEGRVLYTRR